MKTTLVLLLFILFSNISVLSQNEPLNDFSELTITNDTIQIN